MALWRWNFPSKVWFISCLKWVYFKSCFFFKKIRTDSLQTCSTSFTFLPTTFLIKCSSDASLSLEEGKSWIVSLSLLRHSSCIGDGVSVLTRVGTSCRKFCNGALSLFDFCLRLNNIFVEMSECCIRLSVPLFTRLSTTLFSGCLEGVIRAATCQSVTI